MKRLSFFIFLFCAGTGAYAQRPFNDNLLPLLSRTKNDTTRVDLLSRIAFSYNFSKPDSAFILAQEGLKLAQSLNYVKGEFGCKESLAGYWWSVGDFATAIKLLLQVLDFADSQNDTIHQTDIYSELASVHRDQGDYNEALNYIRKGLELARKNNDCQFCPWLGPVAGSIFYEMNKLDSAMVHLSSTYSNNDGWRLLMIGRTQAKMNNNRLAFDYYQLSIKSLVEENNLKDLTGAFISLAELYERNGVTDSAIFYGKQALTIAQRTRFNKEIMEASLLLSNAYKNADPMKALYYVNIAMDSKDSLYNQEKQRQISSYKFNEELRQQEVENAQAQFRSQRKIYILLAIVILFIVIVVSFWYNNSQKKKAYVLLQKQKAETDYLRTKAEQTLEDLKSTQAQLIQSEKMASLGELTAGIAHEIQNPLNFVNNFSEVNAELIAEIKQGIEKGNMDDVKAIADDIKENQEKITQHGKRADAIVKSMLQHSHSNSGIKEPTDINALADEYLRLAYHGLRAKDKSFNATMKTEFDKTIGKINIVPPDIGRVLLNLIINAFYAVTEKNASALQQAEGPAGQQYVPTVSVSTKKSGNKVEVRIKDNGNGVPQKILEKIFQPFFTTKPTGQGTGLGLSLSYDIVKAHGGELKVETKEGEGAEFIIELPI
jgi:signal transduction histidine kinase